MQHDLVRADLCIEVINFIMGSGLPANHVGPVKQAANKSLRCSTCNTALGHTGVRRQESGTVPEQPQFNIIKGSRDTCVFKPDSSAE